MINYNDYTKKLIERLLIEQEKNDRSGVYGETQRLMAYNSNKIEGSKLTFNQTASMFATGTILVEEEQLIKSKDIEEMNGHFIMFNNMLKSYKEPLSETQIKSYHYDLKFGVFEDKANGYPIGEYKNRGNRVSDIITAKPDEVQEKMQELLTEYNKKIITLKEIAIFHAQYELIHPFQDGNGRTGRIILYKECLRNNIFPMIIEDGKKGEYYMALNKAQKGNVEPLVKFFQEEQSIYFKNIKDLLE